MGSWSFTIDGVPRAKERARVGKPGKDGKSHFFTPDTTSDYEAQIAGAAMDARIRWGGLPFRVEVSIYLPNRRRKDGDNVLKVVLDGLQKAGRAVLPDDSLLYVQDKRARLAGIDKARPRIEVEVTEIHGGVAIEEADEDEAA